MTQMQTHEERLGAPPVPESPYAVSEALEAAGKAARAVARRLCAAAKALLFELEEFQRAGSDEWIERFEPKAVGR